MIASETFIKCTKVRLQLRPDYNSYCQIKSPVWPEKRTLRGWFWDGMASASYPDVSGSLPLSLSLPLPPSLSLSMKICLQRKAGRRKRARLAWPPFFTDSHGSLRFVTSHSRFALASIRNHAKNEVPEEEAGMAWFARNDPLYQYSSGTLIKRDKKSTFLSPPG